MRWRGDRECVAPAQPGRARWLGRGRAGEGRGRPQAGALAARVGRQPQQLGAGSSPLSSSFTSPPSPRPPPHFISVHQAAHQQPCRPFVRACPVFSCMPSLLRSELTPLRPALRSFGSRRAHSPARAPRHLPAPRKAGHLGVRDQEPLQAGLIVLARLAPEPPQLHSVAVIPYAAV